MKRQTALALAAVFSLSVAGTALAAPANPFVDVPAKHWSYDSVNKLAQAGVISGYGDGTFKGDRTLTRYEMATIVAKAMANADKADAETKKTIEALKAEYGSELANLGVRVDNLEKNASKVKFTGEIRERYNWQDNDGFDSVAADTTDRTSETTRLRLNMEAPIANNVTFHGRYEAQSAWGSSATAKLTQAYIAGDAGAVGYSFGRQPLWLGQGLIADWSGDADYSFDGIMVSGGKDVKVAGGAFKFDDVNVTVGNIDAKVNKNLNISASYLKDDNSAWYKTTSAGLKYTGIKNFTVTGEYGKNKADSTDAKAWMGQLKYAGADTDKVGSIGVWVGYRSAETGFDPAGLTTLDSGLTDNLNLDNIKGTEFGLEYTVFKNGVLSLIYNDLETKDAGVSKKNFYSTLIYTF